MSKPRFLFLWASLFVLGSVLAVCGQVREDRIPWEMEALTDDGWVEFDLGTPTALATNWVGIRYGGAVLTAERVGANYATGDVNAEGAVRIQQGNQIWASEHLKYNFFTRQIEARQFRTGKAPVFAGGNDLRADTTNNVYIATNAVITTEDVYDPTVKIRARYVQIVPGERIVARDAVLYIGKVPVFWFPVFTRRLDGAPNHFSVTPGYRSAYGPFLMGSYRWFLNDNLDGEFHMDYRQKRGFGAGPDLNYDLGRRWGQGTFRHYYVDDKDPNYSVRDPEIPSDRHRIDFDYDARPLTNLNIKSVVRYQTDPAVVRDFFEGEYRRNPQPWSFLEVNKFSDNFSLDVYAQPRLNEFLETVERLPDIRLTGFRQQVGDTPLYYDSQSSAGWYRRLFPENAGTNVISEPDYSAARADTYHQLTLPKTFFGWLTVAPRVGGRLTYYGNAHEEGGVTSEEYRGVFNTGVETTLKASRLWPEAQNSLFEIDGLRHIVEPSINYVYVPEPSVRPEHLPQFDYQFASLRLLPIDFTDYNAIDSIDTEHAVRPGIRNRLQTKRDDQVVTVVDWNVYGDVRIHPRQDRQTLSDIFSDLLLRPRRWLDIESLTRYDTEAGSIRLALNTFTIRPAESWSFGIGHWYLEDDPRPSPEGLGEGNNILMSTFMFKLNENWAFRTSQHFDAREGRMREHYYTIYRDLRSWTAALALRFRDSDSSSRSDFTIAFTFSLKAAPKFGAGSDSGRSSYSLLGG